MTAVQSAVEAPEGIYYLDWGKGKEGLLNKVDD